MQQIAKRWFQISIVKKLYLIVGLMACLIAIELFALSFAMRTLSAVRAFVQAEGIWSKSQKSAVFALQRYSINKSETEFKTFEQGLEVPEWDRLARKALLKTHPDPTQAREFLKRAQVQPEDIQPMIDLILRFNQVSYLNRAMSLWGEGDEMLALLRSTALTYRDRVRSKKALNNEALMLDIQSLNQRLSRIESEFSESLGAGSRWLERMVLTFLLFAVVSVEGIGLSLAYYTARRLSLGLSFLTETAQRIGRGNFDPDTRLGPFAHPSHDEIVILSNALDQTRALLKDSYQELENRVKARTQELETALAYREEFLSIASHELKTPFTVMHLQLQLLERKLHELEEPLPPQILELTEGARDRSRSLRALLNELFDMTQLRSGHLEILKVPCNLSLLVKEACQNLKLDAEDKASSVHLTIAPDFPAVVFCDSIRISQVFTNLISNALKYGKHGSVEVKLSANFSGNHLSGFVFSVEDHGEGIGEAEMVRVFERFERANSDANITGLGLGLYISKHLVEAHGGTIEVSSVRGKGSIFTVKIPT